LECRARVHTYLINGCDPFGWGNFRGVADRLRAQGYGPVRYGQLYHLAAIRNEIAHLRWTEPDARVAVIGYSTGANGAAWLARQAARDGAPVELLIFVDGVFLPGTAADKSGACRTVSISCDHLLHLMKEAPNDLVGAENVRVPPTGHYGVPTHPAVIGKLVYELDTLAAAPPLPAGVGDGTVTVPGAGVSAAPTVLPEAAPPAPQRVR
jgi:hypothetical protein